MNTNIPKGTDVPQEPTVSEKVDTVLNKTTMSEKMRGEMPQTPEAGRELNDQIQTATGETWKSVRAVDKLKNELIKFSVELVHLKQAGTLSNEAYETVRAALKKVEQGLETTHQQVCTAYDSSEEIAYSLGVHTRSGEKSTTDPKGSAQRGRSAYEASLWRF